MKGAECRLVEYMEGSKKRFVIPVYQRNYDWKTENCKQLYDDLVKVVRQGRSSHFFGSIVSVYNPDGRNTEFLVIDGQQRLTTISLLFLAMYNLMANHILAAQTPSLSQQIYEDYLVDKWQPQETRIKLKPVKNDRAAFGKLFEDAQEHIKESNLTVNYDYFYERLQKEEVTLDELYDAICRLEIINITLNGDDNPQLIFESLNSTGLALSEGDKIRNFILMGLPTKQQNAFYEKYWNRIELCTNYDVSAFIRDYLSVKQQLTPAFNKIYFAFKSYVEEQGMETEPLLQELLFYANQYEVLLKGGTVSERLNACIYRLNRLETTVTRPFFLEVLRLWREDKLDIAEVADIFVATENYLFRRTICDLPTNALNKIFLLLHREIVRFDDTDSDYVSKFKYALLSKRERARFPDDAEFIEAFAARQIYLMNSKNKIYILERFENFGTAEDKDVYRHCDAGEYTVEHIMPQRLTPAWIRSLGADYAQIHDHWLHRMANLTLTAYNSKYSNSTFEEKKTMQDGFQDSGIRLNAFLAQKSQWGLRELEERSAHLMQRALEIWARPVSDFQPEFKQLDFFSLEDDFNLSGRKIARFNFKNTEQPATSWTDMYGKVLKLLHAEDKSVLSKLAHVGDDAAELTQYISSQKENLRVTGEIEPGLYFEKDTITQLKLSVLRRLFKLYGEEPADLMFYLRDEGDSPSDEDAPGSRFALRRRYWAFALPLIQQAHGEQGAFSKVGPSKENWINGYFGIGGFSVVCVANYSGARVELNLGREREENKAAFDHLYRHKADIEAALGIPLLWQRGEDKKSSLVYCKHEGVSITNETDWMQMAKFHAEWSKRFCDVIVPYLREMPF